MHFSSFWAKYLPFWSILLLCPHKKSMGMRCLVGFLICEYQNFCCLSEKLGFCPKTATFGPKYAFLVILGQILALLIHLVLCPTKKQMWTKQQQNEVARLFSDMWVPELLLPSKMIRIFGPKMAIFAPKFAFFVTYSLSQLIWCPVGWLVAGCWLRRASCVSQDTYLLYLVSLLLNVKLLNGFVKIDTWISLSCYMELLKLLQGFF